MDLQQVAVILMVGGAVAWLVYSLWRKRKGSCGCGDKCSVHPSSPDRKT